MPDRDVRKKVPCINILATLVVFQAEIGNTWKWGQGTSHTVTICSLQAAVVKLKKYRNLEKKWFVSLLCIKRKTKTYLKTSPTWESERWNARERVRARGGTLRRERESGQTSVGEVWFVPETD